MGCAAALAGRDEDLREAPTGVTITLDVETWDTIDFVKAKIQDKTLVAKGRLILWFEGLAASGGNHCEAIGKWIFDLLL